MSGLAWRRIASVAIPVVLLVLAAYALTHEIRDMGAGALTEALREVGLAPVLASLTFAFGSYACLHLYDRVALRQLRITVPTRDVVATSFLANTLAQTVGVSVFTGGAVRVRGYRRFGISVAQVGQILLVNTLGFVLGSWVLVAAAMLIEPRAANPVLPGGLTAIRIVGALLAAGWFVAFVAVGPRGRGITVAGLRFSLPGRSVMMSLTLLSTGELALCAASFYTLLPFGVGPHFPGFVGLYLVAVLAGLISTVPAGVGVFEWTMLALLPDVSAAQVLAAALVYRLTYYLIPLAVAVLVAAANHGAQWTVRIAERTHDARTRVRPVLPRLIAVLVFVVGGFLTMTGSASVPAFHRHAVPTPLLESSHLAVSLVGLFMVFLARSLWARSHSAWTLAIVASVASLPLSVLRGGVPPLLLWAITLTLAATLWFARRAFDRAGGIFDQAWSVRWMLSLVAVVGATAWLLTFIHDQHGYDDFVWWRFAQDAQAPRAARSLLVVILVIAALGLTRLLRGERGPLPPGDRAEVERAMAIVARQDNTEANLAMLGDKAFLFSEDGQGFVMMQRFGGSLIAMGDPVGPTDTARELIWAFREHADELGLRPVFFEVGGEYWQTYLDLGLSLTKLGEEAIVPLTDFSLEGRPRKALRQAMNKAGRDGLTFRVLSTDEVSAEIATLAAISREWLGEKSGAEKGFSLGSFDPDYVSRCPVAVIERHGVIVAFANLWTTGTDRQLSIDLMRHVRDVPNGTMDFLFISLFLWGREHGYAQFSLGMAPLTGFTDHRLAGRWNRVASLFARYGERFYGFAGLRHYKEKFGPSWRAHYLAAPSGIGTIAALVDVTRLISLEPVR